MTPVRKPHLDPKDLPSIERATLRRIVGELRPHRRMAAGVAACILGAALFNLAAPWFMKRSVDVAIPSGRLSLLWLYCAGMVAGPVAAALCQVAQKYWGEKIGQQVMLDVRVRLYRQLHEMPFDFFAKQKPGEAVSHVLNDVQGIGGVISGTLVDLVQNLTVLLVTLAFVVVLDWRLGLLAACVLPVFVISTRRVGQRRKAIKRRMHARTRELTGMLTEALSVSGALLAKVFVQEPAEVKRVEGKLTELRDLSLEHTLVGRWFQTLLGLFESIGPAIIFAIGGALVMSGHYPLGTLIAFVTVLKRLYGPASQLASAHVDLLTSYAYFERIFEVMDRTPAIRTPAHPIALPHVDGDIEFKHVSLTYDHGEPALRDVNLKIAAGTTVGLVGPSGSGKTSLASLVMRLYDPSHGSVSIDGANVRDLSLPALRGLIGVVTQDTFMRHATVLENLLYARPGATQAEAEDAAIRAQIHDVIMALPRGYHTLVGERGFRFSAGERQRLAIARAILKNPRILILDEATSALDAASERNVQMALTPLLAGRTNIIIAHRLSTVRDCDLIVVMNDGEIAEQGTHDELIERSGMYAWLWRVQARDDGRKAPRLRDEDGAISPIPDLQPVPARSAPSRRR